MQRRIALYLNFDMIASPNFARLIYDGNGSKFGTPGPAGSDAIERTFERYFDRVGLASGQTAFDGRSDYGPFTAVGIPAGGLFTGAEDVKSEAEQAAYGGTAGEAFDPCYHKACDDINNLSVRALNQMSDAVARRGQPLRVQPRLHSEGERRVARPRPRSQAARARRASTWAICCASSRPPTPVAERPAPLAGRSPSRA